MIRSTVGTSTLVTEVRPWSLRFSYSSNPYFFQGTLSHCPHAIVHEAPAPPQPIYNAPAEPSFQLMHNAHNIQNPEQPLPPYNRWLPTRYQDLLPEPPLPAVTPQPASSTSIIPCVFLHGWDSFTIQFNKFSIAPHCIILTHSSPQMSCFSQPSPSSLAPLRTSVVTTLHLGPGPTCWFGISCRGKTMGGILKSNSEVTQLVHEVLQALDFNIPDLSRFDASREAAWFDVAEKSIPPKDVFGIDGWKHTAREKKKEGSGLASPWVVCTTDQYLMLYAQYLQRGCPRLSISHLSKGSGNHPSLVTSSVFTTNCMPLTPGIKPMMK